MNKTVSLLMAAALGGSVATGACSKSDSQSAAGTPKAAVSDGEVPKFAQADVDFMQGMIGHHAQAIVMAAMAPTHGANPQILLLCKKIDVSQHDEITMMTQWLKDRRQTVPDPNKPMAMAMPGMLTADQMKQLGQARDTRFDRLFLTFMIQHHRGAIAMVKTLFATPGGGNAPEMFRYASDVNADQSAEIERMERMLDTRRAR